MASCCLLVLFSDNYAYVFVCPETGLAGCVDPVEPDKILRTVKDQGAQLATVGRGVGGGRLLLPVRSHIGRQPVGRSLNGGAAGKLSLQSLSLFRPSARTGTPTTLLATRRWLVVRAWTW